MHNIFVPPPPTAMRMLDNDKLSRSWSKWFHDNWQLLYRSSWVAHHIQFVGNSTSTPTVINRSSNYASINRASAGKIDVTMKEDNIFGYPILTSCIPVVSFIGAGGVQVFGNVDITTPANTYVYRLVLSDYTGAFVDIASTITANVLFLYNFEG